MGILYIVPTPIGNLEDITLRALRVLREVSFIAAEDTRRTRQLLAHYHISTPLKRYDDHSGEAHCLRALAEGKDLALVSDAGTPGLADPGYPLIQAVLAAGHGLVPLPGANAAITALAGSGFPTNPFRHLGFLPRKASALRALLVSLREETNTITAYESPRRLQDSLVALRAAFSDERKICVAREISKLHEEFWRGTLAKAITRFAAGPTRGEITLVIAGALGTQERWDEGRLRLALQAARAEGQALGQVSRELALISGWDRRAVYRLGLSEPSATDSA